MGGALMKLLSDLYTMSLVFFALLYVETLNLIRSITGLNPKPADKLIMSAAEYFTLMDERSPPEVFYAAAAGSQPECRVCLSELEEGDEIRRLRCGHVYHMVCLDTWLQGCGATCPLCRARVLPDHAVVAIRRPPGEVDFDGSDEEELILFLSAAIQGGSVFHSLYF